MSDQLKTITYIVHSPVYCRTTCATLLRYVVCNAGDHRAIVSRSVKRVLQFKHYALMSDTALFRPYLKGHPFYGSSAPVKLFLLAIKVGDVRSLRVLHAIDTDTPIKYDDG